MELSDFLDRLAIVEAGGKGTTLAHFFLQDSLARPISNINGLNYYKSRRKFRVFIPPKSEDRVLFFKDNSGVYFHSDGFCTPMGDDISKEILAWIED